MYYQEVEISSTLCNVDIPCTKDANMYNSAFQTFLRDKITRKYCRLLLTLYRCIQRLHLIFGHQMKSKCSKHNTTEQILK